MSLPLQTRIMASVALLALCSACVTKSDLEQLNRDLSLKMDTANSQAREEVASLREGMDQLQTGQKALRDDVTTSVDSLRADTSDALTKLAGDDQQRSQEIKQLDSQIAKTRQALKDYVATNSQALEQIAQVTKDVNQKLARIEQTVGVIKSLPPAVTQLGTELHALRQTLQQTYQLEEVALRQRLKVLEELSRQLEPNPKQAKKTD